MRTDAGALKLPVPPWVGSCCGERGASARCFWGQSGERGETHWSGCAGFQSIADGEEQRTGRCEGGDGDTEGEEEREGEMHCGCSLEVFGKVSVGLGCDV